MKPRAVVDKLLQAYNTRSVGGVAALLHDDVVYWDTLHGELRGLEPVVETIRSVFELVPDEVIELRTLVEDGSRVVGEFVGRLGDGTVVPFVEVYEIRNGKIEQLRLYFDPGQAAS